MIREKVEITKPSIKEPQTAYEYYQLGKRLEEKREFEESEQAFKKAIGMDEKLGKAYLELGHLYSTVVHDDLALEYTKKAWRLLKNKDKRNEAIAHYNLGILYLDRNDLRRSWKHYRKAYEMESVLGDSRWKDDLKEDVYYVVNNDRKGFIKNASKLGHKDYLPKNVVAWQKYFTELESWRRHDEIIKEGEYFIGDHPDGKYNYVISKYLVGSYLSKKRFDDMLLHLGFLDSADIDYQTKAWKHYMYYFYYRQQDEKELALEHLDIVTDKYDKYELIEDVYFDKVELLREMGEIDSERKVLNRMSQRFIDRRLLHFANYRLAIIELYSGNYDESYVYFQKTGLGKPLYLLWFVGSAIFNSGMGVLVLFMLASIFFNKKVAGLKETPYRFRHYFLYGFLNCSIPLLLWATLFYNHYIYGIFNRFHFNPVLVTLIIGNVIIVWYVMNLLSRVYKLDFKNMGFRLSGIKTDLILPIIIVLVVIGVNIGYNLLLEHFGIFTPKSEVAEMINTIMLRGHIVNKILLAFSVVLFIPVVEEIIFRMFMINYFEKFTCLWVAVLYSCVVFAISHAPIHVFPMMFFIALLFSIVYIKTRSIVPSIVAHSINNLTMLSISLLYKGSG
ncbi:type II CAAX prenyl endopeptidase Rce1 family protein [Thermoproteota archaeon]